MKMPKGWSLKPLASLVYPDRKISYGIVQPGDFEPNGVLLVRGQDYSDGWAKPDSMFRVSEAIDAPYRRSRLQAGDIVMTIVGAGTGNIAIVPDYLDGANITQTTARIAVNKTVADRDFIRLVLESHIGRHEVYRNIKGGAQPGLNIGDVEEFQIPTPPLVEQSKIAVTLMPWIKALEKLDALIAAKARRKQALMQQLLTGHRRLPGFSKPWKQVRLDEVFEPLTRKASDKVERALSITAGVGFVDQREKFSRVIAGANLANYILLKRGEFSYNKGNSNLYPQGCVYCLEEYDEGAVPNVWISFRLRDGDNVSDFYKHFFLAGGHNHQLHRLINYGVRNDGLLNLTADNFFTIKVPVPEPKEQQRIGELFNHLNAELRLLRQQRTALDHQKRGLMQQLLTGRIRVKTASS